MTGARSGALAAWATAWLAGAVAPDDVIDAVTDGDAPHQVAGGSAGPASLLDLLGSWRRAGAEVRLVLPVAGDVRGLPGPAGFRAAALDAGEAVVGGPLGVVPVVIDHAPSSAPATVTWHAFAIDAAPADHVQLGEAQYDLTTAVRESASALTAAGVAGHLRDVSEDLRSARRAGEFLNLPPGHPSRAVALLAQAERLQAVLDLAELDPVGGAVDQHGVAARSAALRSLATAVRRARLAGYNALSAE